MTVRSSSFSTDLCPRVGGFVHAKEPLLAHVSVDLRCLQAGMPQKFLHDTKIGTPVQQMSGEGMSKRVWMRRTIGPMVQNPPDITRSEAVSALVQEHRVGLFGRMVPGHRRPA